MSAVIAVAIVTWFGYTRYVVQADQSDYKAQVLSETSHHAESLRVAIERRVGLLDGLEAYAILELESGGDFEEFSSIAQGLVSSVDGVRNVIIAPAGVNEFVFPIEGNEAAVGHDLLADERPEVRRDVRLAIETGREVLSGPYELRQGGQGLVARRAIANSGEFWGFVTMVVDLQPIIDESGLVTRPGIVDTVAYVEGGGVFYGDARVMERDPVEARFEIDQEEWIIAEAPVIGWDACAREHTRSERDLALIALMLGLMGVWFTLRHENRLLTINSELESATQAKDRFLASMSHELRTPLNSIIGFSGILDQELAGPINDEQRRQVRMIRNSGESLLAIVDEVLIITRLQAGIDILNPVRFDVLEFVEALSARMEPLAQAKGLRYDTSVTGGCHMNTDRDKLRAALFNVAANAIAYTDNGEVRLDVECGTDEVTFRVQDTGRGMEPADIESVFEKFEQITPDEGGKNQGVGLGLSIARQIVDMLGGRVSVDSEPGVGSLFEIIVPVDVSQK
ncbi:MAG: ATP-binding protein [Actinomycetota bacterium]|nr:ATP-binding protein [Actinomycetota bacterium]